MRTGLPGMSVASWLVVAGVLASGCAGPADQATPTTTGRAATHHPAYSDTNPRPRRAGNLVVTVQLVSRIPPGAGSTPATRAHPQYWAEEVRTCVARSSRHDAVVRRTDWRAEGMDGRHYRAGVRAAQRPTYPARAVLSPGQCATGWWSITAPPGAVIRAFQLAPQGGPVRAEWLTMR